MDSLGVLSEAAARMPNLEFFEMNVLIVSLPFPMIYFHTTDLLLVLNPFNSLTT